MKFPFKCLAILILFSISKAQFVDYYTYVIDLEDPEIAIVREGWRFVNLGNETLSNETHPFVMRLLRGDIANITAYSINLTAKYLINTNLVETEVENIVYIKLDPIESKKSRTIELVYKRSDFIDRTDRGYLIRDITSSPWFTLEAALKIIIPKDMQVGNINPEPNLAEITNKRLSLRYEYDKPDKLEFYLEYGKFLELSNQRIKKARERLDEARLSLNEARSTISTIPRDLTNSSIYYKQLGELNESYYNSEDFLRRSEELKNTRRYAMSINYSTQAENIAYQINKNTTKLKTDALLFLQDITKKELKEFKEKQEKIEEKISEVEEKRIQAEKEREKERKRFLLMIVGISLIFLIILIFAVLPIRRGKR